MKQIKYNGELYNCCAPRPIGDGKHTCDAWKQKTGRVVNNNEILNALGLRLIHGRKEYREETIS